MATTAEDGCGARPCCVVGAERHPRTGLPPVSGIEYASAIAAEGWQAETLAKAVLIRGGPPPFELIDGAGVEVLTVADDGTVASTAGFARFTDGVQLASCREYSS